MTPIIILSLPRSGSHALSTFLAQSNSVQNYSEILYNVLEKRGPGNIRRFAEYLYYNNTTEEEALDKFDYYFNNYMNIILSEKKYRFGIFSIKYHHILKHINTTYILDYLIYKNIPTIHLIRKNQKHRYISHSIVEKCKFNHFSMEEIIHYLKTNILKFKIDNQLFLDYDKKYTAQVNFIKEKVKNQKNCVELIYEETFEKNKLTEKALAKLSKILPHDLYTTLEHKEIPYIYSPWTPQSTFYIEIEDEDSKYIIPNI